MKRLLFALLMLVAPVAPALPMEAIRAATYWPAQLLRQPDLGVIAPGKLADIIVVDGDPLSDMSALRHIVHVIKDGKQYK